MSTPQVHENTSKAEGQDSEVRERRETTRQYTGLLVGIALAVLVYLIFPSNAVDTLSQSAGADPEADYSLQSLRIVAAITVLMGTWWMTEAIPLAATAMVPLVVFPLFQVGEFSDVATPYASATIFLFLGGFLIALGLQRWNVHRRIALLVVLVVGTSPKRLILGFMIATGFLSMWVSNTATAVVMLPIGMSVLQLTADVVGGMRKQAKFATALMLAIAYSASIGSLGTLIGTPPNALLAGYMSEAHGYTIGFAQWMMVGMPIAVVFVFIAWAVLVTVFKPEMTEIPGGRELIKKELHEMGKWTGPQIGVSIIFVLAALAWIFVPLILDQWLEIETGYQDAIVGIAAGLLMFAIPADKKGTRLMDWKTANELPWDVLLLFGGGLALSSMFTKTGLSLWIGEIAKWLGSLPLFLLIFAVAGLVLILTEFTSNTATAATFLPIMGGVAVGIGLTENADHNVLVLAIPVALAATCAFMLPVATPPNAIAFGSGYVRIGDMIKGGVWLNVVAVILTTLVVYFVAIPVFDIVL